MAMQKMHVKFFESYYITQWASNQFTCTCACMMQLEKRTLFIVICCYCFTSKVFLMNQKFSNETVMTG